MKILIETRRFGVKEVEFDDEDKAILSQFSWHVVFEKKGFYARAHVKHNGKYRCARMHRIIMGVDGAPVPHIDHINGNSLDNRRCNLRFATIAENTRNSGPNSKSVTGYKGVSLYKVGSSAGKYVVRLRHAGKKYFGGYFNDPIEAAKKYNELAKKHHGEFAYLNKV